MSLIPQILGEIYQPLHSITAAPVDWKETAEAHVLKADLPGMKKEEVKVEVEDGGRVLQISGERPAEKQDEEETKNERWHRVERPCGGFRRRFYLPANAKTDEVKAAMENGVLILTIPKKEIKKPEVKQIEIVTN
ncbi:HSP20-like chaperones superfamily protein [Perilla frutescens var. hirtella]|uniref:HSP20-like chaperones superfamily protein n=1 Tax=Perilla frutescens var. hirtella TaxID=608512 RepID=A0AAD4P7Y5_PERFH|nr:HSP20-like chaperones superfamily protein [Perilla frutescens var. hirtella]